MEENIISKKMI